MARSLWLDGGPDVSAEILTRAAELFYQRGYDATSIRELADAVGISSSTLYHHYKNKQQILHAIVRGFMTDFNDAIIPVLQDRSVPPRDRLAQAARLHLRISEERRHQLLLGNPFRWSLGKDELSQVVGQQRAYHGAVRKVVREILGLRRPGTRDELATMAILDMLNGVREWYRPSGQLTIDQIADRYVDLINDLLTPR